MNKAIAIISLLLLSMLCSGIAGYKLALYPGDSLFGAVCMFISFVAAIILVIIAVVEE